MAMFGMLSEMSVAYTYYLLRLSIVIKNGDKEECTKMVVDYHTLVLGTLLSQLPRMVEQHSQIVNIINNIPGNSQPDIDSMRAQLKDFMKFSNN